MKASEIKALSAEQRSKKLAELKEELFNLHFQQAINQLDNHASKQLSVKSNLRAAILN